MWTVTLWDHTMPAVQWGVVLSASLAGTVTDLGSRRIRNRLTGPILFGGLAWAAWTAGPAGLADAAAACVLMALPYVLLFAFFGGGAGDAKLMGALGTWLGVVNGMVVLISVLLSGVVIAIGFALAKKQFGKVLANLVGMASSTAYFVLDRETFCQPAAVQPGTRDMLTIPYGIAIFAGVCIAATGVLLWRAS